MTTLYWEGKPITDVHAWARERGCQMVSCKVTTREFDLYGATMIESVRYERIPAVFFDNLLIRARGIERESWSEIERLDPDPEEKRAPVQPSALANNFPEDGSGRYI